MAGEKNGTRHPVTEIVSHIEETHRRIREDLEVLDGSNDLAQIRTVVDDLPALLREHFQDEEKPGGLFDELVSLRPVVDSQLKSLRQEHREIMQVLRDLQRETHEMDERQELRDQEQRVDHIRRSAVAFLKLIRAHELIESRLVADTYYSEDGGRG